MSRELISLSIPDLSGFAKSLRADPATLPALPGHLALLGLIARAAGYRNYQDLKSRASPVVAPDDKRLQKALRCFDATGRMQNWPTQNRDAGPVPLGVLGQFTLAPRLDRGPG